MCVCVCVCVYVCVCVCRSGRNGGDCLRLVFVHWLETDSECVCVCVCVCAHYVNGGYFEYVCVCLLACVHVCVEDTFSGIMYMNNICFNVRYQYQHCARMSFMLWL